jgi:hypothetical protein
MSLPETQSLRKCERKGQPRGQIPSKMEKILYSVHHHDNPVEILAYTTCDIRHEALKLTTRAIQVDESKAADIIQSAFIPAGSGFTTKLENYLWRIINRSKNPTVLAATFIRLNEILLTIHEDKATYAYGADSTISYFIEECTGISEKSFDVQFDDKTGVFRLLGLPLYAEFFLNKIFSRAAQEGLDQLGAKYLLQVVGQAESSCEK